MTLSDPLLLDLPSSLSTERMILRTPEPGDGPAFHEAVSESLPELRKFLASLSWVGDEQSIHAAEAFCRNAQANFLARRALPFFMFERASGRFLGATGLYRPEWATPKLELGYWCRSGAGGRGFVHEAVSAVTEYAFTRAHAVRVEARTDEENTKSRRVVERFGFTLEGLLRSERRAPDGSLRNTCVYAKVKPSATSVTPKLIGQLRDELP